MNLKERIYKLLNIRKCKNCGDVDGWHTTWCTTGNAEICREVAKETNCGKDGCDKKCRAWHAKKDFYLGK